MRVATYNIRHGAAPRRLSDIGALGAAARTLDVDVLALQEVDRRVFRSGFTDQAARVATDCGLKPQFGRARGIGPFSGYGNALLTRTEPRRVDVMELRSFGEQRIAVIAEVDIDDESATFVSVHLQNRRKGRPPQALSQLDQVLATVSCRPEPWVVMGDFNLRPDVVLPRLADAGMVSASVQPTFPADDPKIAIDWIAVRGLEVVDVEVPDIRCSDHRPLVADLVTVNLSGAGQSGGGRHGDARPGSRDAGPPGPNFGSADAES